jgi:hypothetical protein
VRASGHYVRGADTFLTGQFRGKKPGFDVLTPLRTPSGTLLVDRGFVAAGAHGSPKQPPAAPGGAVTVLGRLNPVTSGSASTAPQGVDGIRQAISVRAPSTYRAYVTLDKGQPGGQGLVAAPAPNLSNPYGGAYEWQHFAYIVQWYLFALLALLAPFLVARNEVRDARRRWLGIDPADIEIDDLPELAPSSGARLELPAASAAELPALRQAAAIERVQRVAPERLEQARRNADRYGRSLGPDDGSSLFPNWRRNRRDLVPTTPVTDSSRTPHRSDDAHHAAYNDYLWQLAMADGDIPDVEIGPRSPVDEDE